MANDTPRNLKLAHGKRSLVVTVGDPNESGLLSDIALSMDDIEGQLRLAELMAQGNVRAAHSQEASLEEVFIEVAGIRPA